MKIKAVLGGQAERDLMRRMEWEGRWTLDDFANWLKMDRQGAKQRAKKIVAELVERGLIERATDCEVKRWGRKRRYRLTQAGHRLAAKKRLRGIPRAKAKQG